eukprot:CAMPEP_0181098660 /NCGR_PEP_ID=MMETSP1071-20121207/12245_1 /TAXON_ID=35127 /ORGANISM="Thalassiosira sp., Strain NH16" /LENGTH=162 /DNA_ID=CAMNT_0023181271 /DNA_START=49 /DNA_END=541 /DNA_ORIENTATION=-
MPPPPDNVETFPCPWRQRQQRYDNALDGRNSWFVQQASGWTDSQIQRLGGEGNDDGGITGKAFSMVGGIIRGVEGGGEEEEEEETRGWAEVCMGGRGGRRQTHPESLPLPWGERFRAKMKRGLVRDWKNAASPSSLANDSRDRSSVACLVEGLEGDDFEKLG